MEQLEFIGNTFGDCAYPIMFIQNDVVELEFIFFGSSSPFNQILNGEYNFRRRRSILSLNVTIFNKIYITANTASTQ